MMGVFFVGFYTLSPVMNEFNLAAYVLSSVRPAGWLAGWLACWL